MYVPPTAQARKLFRLTSYELSSVESMAAHVKDEISKRSRQPTDDVNCPLCMSPLYDGVDFNSDESISAAVEN